MLNTMKTPIINAHIHGTVKGQYVLGVVNRRGEVRYPFGLEPRNNLLLDSGLNRVFTDYTGVHNLWVQDETTRARLGSGDTAPVVTDTALEDPIVMTDSLFTGSGANGISYDLLTGKATYKKTFEFPAESGSVTYREVGIGRSSGSQTLFSRIVLPSPVTLSAGENIRLSYQFTLGLPQIVTPTPVTASTTGWDATGELQILGTGPEIFGNYLTSPPQFSGGTAVRYLSNYTFNGGISGQPGARAELFQPPNSLARSTDVGAVTPYVPGSFQIDKFHRWVASNPGDTFPNVTLVDFYVGTPPTGGLFRLALDSPQEKSNQYALTINVRTSLARV